MQDEQSDNQPDKRLVIVSNRLPVSVKKDGGRWKVAPSAGGLVTALGPVLRNRGGKWIGWPGVEHSAEVERVLERETAGIGYDLVPVSLDQDEVDNYYYGFSNEILWPLFHNLQSLCHYHPDYWQYYQSVNRKFGDTLMEHLQSNDLVWVNDYQLMTLAHFLREEDMRGLLGFFLHIPFPPPDIYHKLPWRRQILEALMQYDLVGLQTQRHKRNFLHVVRTMLPNVKIYGTKGPVSVVSVDGREVRVGSFPIGIDYNTFARGADTQEVAAQTKQLKTALRNRCIILGVDRLDYTKGLPYRLDAVRNALHRYPQLRHKINLIQVVVPSRQEIPRYQELRNEIEQLVGEINGEFAEPGWVPIQYIYRSLPRPELLAYYRAAEIALITPLEDGMNLVAKEYCAASDEDDSVLILSEFAGAAAQLYRGALLVNPYDLEGVADAIYQAYTMDADERAERMRRMRRSVQTNNVFRWVESFLKAGSEKRLEDFPKQQEVAQSLEEVEFWWGGGGDLPTGPF